jgi:bisphosphoglycerate-dependent phosphoglycerate mutase
MLTGKEREEFEERMGEAELRIVRRAYYSRAPHGESVQDVEKRVKPFIKDIISFIKRNRVNVAISASGNSMRPIRRFFEHASIDEMMSWEMPFDDYFEYEVRV